MEESEAREEHELVRRLRRGDEAALSAFCERFLDRVYAFLYHRVAGDEQIADDLTQETFLAALDALERFDGRARLYTWLCSIARHKLTDHYRRRYRFDRVRAALERLPDDHLDPSEWVEREERRRQALAVLRKLPTHYQQVLVLKYLDGIGGRQLAEDLGLSEHAVESLLARARSAFRRGFRDAEYGTKESNLHGNV